ncbi:MAG: hypothetical protein ACKN9X_00945 [Candidatus Methylopumilus sp.]
MKKIHIIKKEEYSQMLKCLNLDNLKANTFGLDEYFPLKNINAVDKLYKDYTQRDQWLADFLKNKINKRNLKNIIWSESGRINNNEYIYRKENEKFKYENEESNYFNNVTESRPLEECIVIDFFGLFGLNHSNDSRDTLNKNASRNSNFYNQYLNDYVSSIRNMIQLNQTEFNTLNHAIAAPKETSKSILNHLRSQLKIVSDIKIYKLNSRGLVSKIFYIDKLKQTDP